jgi:glycosyltransferase involved in cell wall biosynthesis
MAAHPGYSLPTTLRALSTTRSRSTTAAPLPEQCGLLWVSNSPGAPTGYGNQTALFTRRLHQAGYRVVIAAFYGREAFLSLNPDGILELPRLRDAYMNDIIVAHLAFCRSHYPQVARWLVWTLVDPFVFEAAVFGALPWAAWAPEDCSPLKPGNAAVLQHCRWPVAVSRFGETQLQTAGLNPRYIPHAYDPALYFPLSARPAARARLSAEWGVELLDKFLVVNVSANKGYPSRKNFDGLLQSFALFSHSHADALLYLHTETEGIWQGEKVRQIAASYGLAEKVIFPQQYRYVMSLYGAEYLNAVYNAADVMLHLALGEGFGLPVLEAQAAGCPVIVTDFSALPELCFGGWRVPALPFGLHSPSRWALPLVPEAVKALEDAYQRAPQRRQQAIQGAQAYQIERVLATSMQPALASMFSELP